LETFVINIHSFVDVITNSSTEIFVGDSDKSIKLVKEILGKIVAKEGYNFDSCFEEPVIVTKTQ